MEYLTTKVTPVLEPLILELLAHRPADTLAFMAEWIQKRRGVPTGFEENKKPGSERAPTNVRFTSSR